MIKQHLPKLPALVLVLGAILRIAGTGAAALWADESNMLFRSSIPFLTLFTEHSENSNDLLSELILRPLLAVSHSLWILRLPSILAGLVSLWLVWKLMQWLEFSLRQQIITSAIAAFLPGLLWIAQDARSYSLLACLFLAGLWFALESRWLGLLAVTGLIVYTHSVGPVLVAALLIIAAYLYPWKIRSIFLVGLGVILAWIPALLRMLSNWIIQQPWQPQLTVSWLVYSTIWAIWPMLYGLWFYLAASLVLVATLFLLISKLHTRGRLVPLLAWLVPGLGLIISSLIMNNNVLLYRVLTPMLFPFAMWLGWEIGNKRMILNPLFVIWLIILIIGLVLWHPAERGGYLDQVANQIRSHWRTGDTLVYTTSTVGMPFDYYLGDLPHTWDDTVQHPFLSGPGMPHISLRSDTPTRSWVVIPEDGLITPTELALLEDMVHHQEPVYTIAYMQAATINVYLVEDK